MLIRPISSRRQFLRHGASMIALGATVPAFLAQTVQAARRGANRRSAGDGRILVVLQLAGGNDGLNTIVPVTDDAYYRVRPTLAIQPADTLSLDRDFAVPAAARGLKQLHDQGWLGVVHGVGYPNPNRSHFRSMDIWHSAAPDARRHTGWLGRYFDNTCRGAARCSPAEGIALMSEAPLALHGDRFRSLAFERPDTLQWSATVRQRATGEVVKAMNRPRPNDASPPENTLEFLRRVSLDAHFSAAQVREATRGQRPDLGMPTTGIGRQLETVLRLLAVDLPTRVYYLSQGGYDTHAGQAGAHTRLVRDLGGALQAFFAALQRMGLLDRVLLVSFSEFGRRVVENASRGTDHGAAGPMFIAGGPVAGGLHGTPPSLTDLDRGDLRFGIDFRRVYATVLAGWLGIDADAVLGAHFKPLPLLAT